MRRHFTINKCSLKNKELKEEEEEEDKEGSVAATTIGSIFVRPFQLNRFGFLIVTL